MHKDQFLRAVAEAVSRWLPTAAARVHHRVWQVGFVVDKVASGQVFSEYFGFPFQNHFVPPTSPSSQSLEADTQRPCDEPTVLDLLTEMRRKVSWRRPRPKIGLWGHRKKGIGFYIRGYVPAVLFCYCFSCLICKCVSLTAFST
jgi:hypothetical protein